jgi:hypothetical protein
MLSAYCGDVSAPGRRLGDGRQTVPSVPAVVDTSTAGQVKDTSDRRPVS